MSPKTKEGTKAADGASDDLPVAPAEAAKRPSVSAKQKAKAEKAAQRQAKRKRSRAASADGHAPAPAGAPAQRDTSAGVRSLADAPASATERSSRVSDDSASSEAARYSRDAVQRERAKKGRVRLVMRVAIGVLAVAVAGVCAYCAWTIWWRYDDAADIQGTWRSNSGATITIDADKMHLTDDVSYDYTLDTGAKIIVYAFSSSQGQGSYRFSPDRSALVIDESGSQDWLVALGFVEDPQLDGTVDDGVSVLVRTS